MPFLSIGRGDIHFLMLLVLSQRHQHKFVVGSEKGGFVAVEKHAVVKLRIQVAGAPQPVLPDNGTIGEIHRGRKRIGSGYPALENFEAARCVNRFRHIKTHDGADNIDVVNAPVHQVSVSVFLFEPPCHVSDGRFVRKFRGGAAPGIPIQRRRRRLHGCIGFAGTIMDLSAYLADFSGGSVVDQLFGFLKRFALAALKTNLHDVSGLLRGLHHRFSLFHVVSQRFFAINGQSFFAGGNKLQRVPLRRRSYQHGFQSAHIQ